MRIKTFSVLILCITIFTACHIVYLPSKGKDDLYTQYSQDTHKEYRITFIETTADEMLASRYNHLYLFAEWCPGCYLHMHDLTKGNSTNDTAYISCNYNLAFMDKHFKGIDTVYILSNKAYGPNEYEKVKIFSSSIMKSNTSAAELPQKFKRLENRFVRVEL